MDFSLKKFLVNQQVVPCPNCEDTLHHLKITGVKKSTVWTAQVSVSSSSSFSNVNKNSESSFSLLYLTVKAFVFQRTVMRAFKVACFCRLLLLH